MVTKVFKFLVAFVIINFMQSCPGYGEEICDDVGSTATVDNLITITPLKKTYQQGEEIIYKMTIPAENNYFGNTLNLYTKTGVINAWYIASSTNIFDNNTVTYLKGSERVGASNWHNAIYNPANGNYELEIKVTLNKLGEYSSFAEERVDFIGSTTCNKNFINTTIAGNVDKFIKFKVE